MGLPYHFFLFFLLGIGKSGVFAFWGDGFGSFGLVFGGGWGVGFGKMGNWD